MSFVGKDTETILKDFTNLKKSKAGKNLTTCGVWTRNLWYSRAMFFQPNQERSLKSYPHAYNFNNRQPVQVQFHSIPKSGDFLTDGMFPKKLIFGWKNSELNSLLKMLQSIFSVTISALLRYLLQVGRITYIVWVLGVKCRLRAADQTSSNW